MTNHSDILTQAVVTLADKNRRYGNVADTFDRAALIATTILGKHITLYDVSVIMHAMELAKISSVPTEDRHYVDGINFLSLAAQFSQSEEQASVALEQDIAAMARKFAPVKYQQEQEAPVENATAE